jgi:hypothetical protein
MKFLANFSVVSVKLLPGRQDVSAFYVLCRKLNLIE